MNLAFEAKKIPEYWNWFLVTSWNGWIKPHLQSASLDLSVTCKVSFRV